MVTTHKPVEEMTEEERNAAFEKWMEGDRAKKVRGQAKRAAIQDLTKKYKTEYDALVTKHTNRLGGTSVPAKAKKA